MDIMERRVREVFATLLSRGAKALERTAGELERAASDLRQQRESAEPDRVWSEARDEPDTMTRGAPLRAVPDTPSDEAPAGDSMRDIPPVRPPRTPERDRPGDVDARPATSPGATSPGGTVPDHGVPTLTDPIRAMASGSVSEIKAQLPDLSPEELRALRDVELANRNRITLLAAIDRALESA